MLRSRDVGDETRRTATEGVLGGRWCGPHARQREDTKRDGGSQIHGRYDADGCAHTTT